MSAERLDRALAAAKCWRDPGSSLVHRVNDDVLRACFNNGVIGVSAAMNEVMAALEAETQRVTPVMLTGDPGTPLELAARCIHELACRRHDARQRLEMLRCAGLADHVLCPESGQRLRRDQRRQYEAEVTHVLQDSGQVKRVHPLDGVDDQASELDIRIHRASPGGALLLTDIEGAPLPVQRRFVDLLAADRLKVLATTHESVAALERRVEQGSLLRELLNRLRTDGNVYEIPALCLRPEDLPLLIYCFVERFHRGDPEGEVKAIAAEWLYFAAGRRWPGNVDELERSVTEACRTALRIDGTIRCFQQGEDTLEQVDWPADCPFGLSWPSYLQAQHDLKERGKVAVEDLPGYDLKSLLEAVDAHVEPADRGHWTIEARRRHLESERHGRPPEEGLTAIKVTPDPPAEERPAVIPFPRPDGVQWSQVKIRFKDGHTLSARVLGEWGTYNYAELGMVNRNNGNPTVQWELLRTFAEWDGILTWDSPQADRVNQKRKERLSKALRKFFGIDGDPITWDDKAKAWRTRFQIEPT